MKLSCHSWAFPELPLPELARRVRSLGFEYVDLGAGQHLDVDAAVAQPTATGRHIRTVLHDHGLRLADAFPVLLYPALNGPRGLARREQLEPPAACLAEAGSPGLSVSPGLCQDDGFAASWSRSVDALHQVVAIMSQFGLTARVECHFDSVANTPSRAERLLRAVPGLTLLFNAAHWEMQAISHEQVQPLMAYASHVKLRQARPGKLSASFDAGTLDLARIVHGLQAARYKGLISLGSAPREYGQSEVVWASSFEDRVADPEAEVVRLKAFVESTLTHLPPPIA